MEQDVPLPRNFKLLAEYDAAIGKGGGSLLQGEHAVWIQYGADEDKDDMLLHHWQGMIMGPQGKQTGECIYTFTCFCSDTYPEEPPRIVFTGTKVVMPAVDNKGNVNLERLKPPFRWDSRLNIADALTAIRKNLCDPQVISASYPVRNQTYR
eukprot:TRINITY_DN1441_c0_g2_i1.p1 TRINITY_DN1441_c0_g2~~TRINITY_DN1441_c0_g2_i1.p1  ORF type:complete len:152 (+),score=20.98 TRINITY_DN1441_c0_g2_i1:91-546(+)